MKIVLGLLLLISIMASAESALLSEGKLYRRCYSQLVQSPLPLRDPILKDIKDKKITAQDACLNLLNQADLDSQGLLKTHPNAVGTLPQKILRTFHEFHSTWFNATSMSQVQDYNEELNRGSADVYDAYEQSYFLTRALFTRDVPFSSVLKGTDRLKSVRVENTSHIRDVLGGNFVSKIPSRRIIGDSVSWDENLIVFNSLTSGFNGNGDQRPDSDFDRAPLVSIGDLIGIQSLVTPFVVKNFSMNPLGADRPANREPNIEFTYNLNRNHGGGIIGLPSYFMMNYGHGRGLFFNGTTKLPRRWVQAILETFMCATLPTLRESDILNLVVSDSKTPFRKSSSCVQCHATMDQAAGVARNLVTGGSDFFQISAGRNQNAKYPVVLSQSIPTREPASEWIHVDDPEFHLSRPKGKLFTRLFNGELLDRSVDSIDSLGTVITQTQDFYSCAAKRYFEFFTGIKVPLYDKKDPRYSEMNRNLTEDHIKNRQFVETLGFELQQDQSLKNLVRRIMTSDYYKRESFQ